MGRPPRPIIRAMPERKHFFSIDVFPNNHIYKIIEGGLRRALWRDPELHQKVVNEIRLSLTGLI